MIILLYNSLPSNVFTSVFKWATIATALLFLIFNNDKLITFENDLKQRSVTHESLVVFTVF